MKKIVWFYLLYIVFLTVLGYLIVQNDKGGLHEILTLGWIDKCGKEFILFCDLFFKYITHVGGFIPVLAGLALLFVRFGYAYFVLLSQIVVAIIVKIMKVCVNAPRPKLFFADRFPDTVLHQVDGVSFHLMHSFPSGHTAAVFSLMLCLSLIVKKSWASAVFLLLAVCTAYSRIYLSQHFAEDVFAGSLVGVFATLLVYWIYNRERYGWQNLSLLTIIKKKHDKR